MDIKNFIRRNRLKVFLFPVFLLLNVFYFPYIYYFYCRRLKRTSCQQQLFFLARDEYGAILHLLYAAHCWTNIHNGAALVILTPKFHLVRRLARHICPAAQIISPCDLFSQFMQKVFAIFMQRLVFRPLYYKLLRKYPEALYIYEINENSKCAYVKYLDNVYNNRPHDSPFWDAYVQTRSVFDCRFDVHQYFLKLATVSGRITFDDEGVRRLLKDLKISGRYAYQVYTRRYCTIRDYYKSSSYRTYNLYKYGLYANR